MTYLRAKTYIIVLLLCLVCQIAWACDFYNEYINFRGKPTKVEIEICELIGDRVWHNRELYNFDEYGWVSIGTAKTPEEAFIYTTYCNPECYALYDGKRYYPNVHGTIYVGHKDKKVDPKIMYKKTKIELFGGYLKEHPDRQIITDDPYIKEAFPDNIYKEEK